MQNKTFHNADTRGAALLVAIGILAVLLIISVSFFRLATFEMQTANNYANGIQAELGVDAAIAIAIHELQKDAQDHPSVTSTDHAWRTKFNGTWAVGKYWAQADNIYPMGVRTSSLFPDKFDGNVKGIPMVDFDALRTAIGNQSIESRLMKQLYIPRKDISGGVDTLPSFIQGGTIDSNYYLTNSVSHPFIVSTELAAFDPDALLNSSSSQTLFTNPFDPTQASYDLTVPNTWLPEQQIHFFTDVDNDGDNLNDSIWLPLTADRLFPNDGLDNDLDGFIDDRDPDGEPGIFLYAENYIAGTDDDVNDREIKLTMPLNRMFMWRNISDPANPGAWTSYGITIADLFPGDIPTQNQVITDPLEGDNSDNDFNSFIDDGIDTRHYFLNREFRLANQGTFTPGHFDYPNILALIRNVSLSNGNGTGLGDPNIEIRILGEPVSEIIGRQAILITDESSKVNINQAGGLVYTNDNSSFPMTRSTGTGLTTHQYEIRSLDNIGPADGDRLWTRIMGASISDPTRVSPLKSGSALATQNYVGAFDPTLGAFENNYGSYVYDMSFPGYGFVDDNGSALWMATNGIDDDGDAYYYQNDGIDNDIDGVIDEDGEGILVGVDEGLQPYDYDGDGDREYAPLEGIDEPSEYQRFQPYRNLIAENDTSPPTLPAFGIPVADLDDNDSDGIVDEIGELGDHPYRTIEQIKLEEDIADPSFTALEPFITVHSVDDNLSRSYQNGSDLTSMPSRTATGIKLDINYATPAEIAKSLVTNFPYVPSIPKIINARNGTTNRLAGNLRNYYINNQLQIPANEKDAFLDDSFAGGLRQEDTTFVSATATLGMQAEGRTLNQATATEQLRMMADAELRAYQLAVTAKDFADANYSRSSLSLTVPDTWLNELELIDLSPAGNPALTNNTMTYTQAGVEAIRINEIMVRPVRRVEAEATPAGHPGYAQEYDPNHFSAGNPDDFDFTVNTTAMALSDTPYALDPIPHTPDDDFYNVWTRQDGGQTGMPSALDAHALLGLRSVYAIYQNYIGVHDVPKLVNGIPTVQSAIVPDLIEYSFRPSTQLPAGRYYLTVNTQFVHDNEPYDLVNSVESPEDMAYFLTTGVESESFLNRMVEHIAAPIFTTENLYANYRDFRPKGGVWQSPAVIGRDALGISTGMAFMQGADANKGFTVEIPTLASGDFLHIAIMRTKRDAVPLPLKLSPLAINYFDFSQEPDHEWVELANVSEEEVDISGWRLVVEGDGGIEMTVPNDTWIAPKGYLLLGTNKFDYMNPASYDPTFGGTVAATAATQKIYTDNWAGLNSLNDPVRVNTLHANGIGLATGTVPGVTPDFAAQDWFVADGPKRYEDITVPPFFNNVNSPFDPSGTNDFVDNDGNGLIDTGVSESIPGNPPPGTYSGVSIIENNLQSTLDPDILGLSGSTKSWDRIVELEIPALDGLDSLGEIGNFVLKGGIFPNYPEYDRIDNDSDNNALINDIFDNNATGSINDVNEGIDEGRNYLHPANWSNPLNIPGAFNQLAPPFDQERVPLLLQTSGMTSPLQPFYPVNQSDPPDWKAFVEKRLFPGDNVIVNLYEGTRNDEPGTHINRPSHIVDSITYTELDVINRTIDDILDYEATTGSELGLHNPDYPTMWPPNTMGIDFYKSMERKHPLYNGDKHGVTNRSQPTDGRYDDWADSAQYYIREIELDQTDLFDFGTSNDSDVNHFNEDANHDTLFHHTLFGSPLRMNLSQRKAENPQVPVTSKNTFVSEGQFDFALNPSLFFTKNGATLDRQLIYPLVNVRNNPIVTPGDLMNMPHYDRIQRTRGNIGNFPIDHSAVNQRIILRRSDNLYSTGPAYIDNSVRQIMLGHTFADINWDRLRHDPAGTSPALFFGVDFRIRDNAFANTLTRTDILANTEAVANTDANDRQNDLSNDLDQLIANTAASDALSLSVATATVVPFNGGAFIPWGGNVSNTIEWAPVLLFPLATDDIALPDFPLSSPIYEQKYLFSNTLSNTIPGTVNTDRWPYERRAVTYASRNSSNIATFNFNNSPHEGKEALFIWDGNDGIENGEYDVYIAVNEDVSDLYPISQTSSLLWVDTAPNPDIEFGRLFLEEALRTDGENMLMDIELFTDRDGNGRVWWPTAGQPGAYSDLNAGATTSNINESFEQIQNVVPDRNGFINYGAVTVENNYLAVFIRNRADSSVLNRFTRVVLAPRTKTPGRLNINTVETQYIYDTANPRFFNPLVGTPGIQFGFNEFFQTYGQGLITNPAVTTNPNFNPIDPDNPLVSDSYGFFSTSPNRPGLSQADVAIHFRARRINETRARGRNEHADGRYFEHVTDLIQPELKKIDLDNDNNSNDDDNTIHRMVYPPILSVLASDLEHDLSIALPVYGNEESPRFKEIQNRFGRMVNMITTRSDVFKIQVTVQTGTVDDVNGDGILNYRDDREFSVTSEKKGSTVYER